LSFLASSVTPRIPDCQRGTATIELLLAYYADDFTGSTDALEALTLGGVETALFVDPPEAETLRRYPHVRAIGVAGNSRAMSPAQMDGTLPGVFRLLLECRPAVVHYKTCSTFDSSPEMGSIGRAIDLGQRTFANRFVPLVVGVPHLQRFCVFGNLFARSGLASATYRLDRHPTMRHHPTTPMTEADLRLHLAPQTTRAVELVDVVDLDRGYETSREVLDRLCIEDGYIVMFDTLTDEHLALIGRLMWDARSRERGPLFAVGSSGVEYALTKKWQADGTVPKSSRIAFRKSAPVDRTLVVSGSCSPVTRRQIAWALEHGFDEVRLDASPLHRSALGDTAPADVIGRTLTLLDLGRSVIIHTYADLIESPSGEAISTPRSHKVVNERLGDTMGQILLEVLRAASIQRVAVVGGDTAGRVARSMGIESLEMAAPLEPGAPLCVARSQDPAIDGLEVVFKGGQVGYDDFFGSLLSGGASCTLAGRMS
jgi:uncharacterized protein YgbK (DUF1537 family)